MRLYSIDTDDQKKTSRLFNHHSCAGGIKDGHSGESGVNLALHLLSWES